MSFLSSSPAAHSPGSYMGNGMKTRYDNQIRRQDSLGWALEDADINQYSTSQQAPTLKRCMVSTSPESELNQFLHLWDSTWRGWASAHLSPSTEPGTVSYTNREDLSVKGSGQPVSALKAALGPSSFPLSHPILSRNAMPLGYGSGVAISSDPSSSGGGNHASDTNVGSHSSRASGSGAISIGAGGSEVTHSALATDEMADDSPFNLPMTPPMPHAALSLAKSRAAATTAAASVKPVSHQLPIGAVSGLQSISQAVSKVQPGMQSSSATIAHPVPQPTGKKSFLPNMMGFKNVFFSPIPQSYLTQCASQDSILATTEDASSAQQTPLSHAEQDWLQAAVNDDTSPSTSGNGGLAGSKKLADIQSKLKSAYSKGSGPNQGESSPASNSALSALIRGGSMDQSAASNSYSKPISCAPPASGSKSSDADDRTDLDADGMPKIPPTPPVPSGLVAQLRQEKAAKVRPTSTTAHLDLLMTGPFSSISAAAEKHKQHEEWADLKLVASCAMIPHKDKVDKGGEDAYCICQSGLGSIGAADGVSGWAEEGIDPAEYSRTLMRLTAEKLESAGNEEISAREVIRFAHMATFLPGSSTVCLAVMKPHGRLEIANVGDSGVRIVRNGKLIFASAAQQHMFNMPFQLSHPSIIDSPDDADSADVTLIDVEPGDVIVLATDGLYDNMFDEEIVRLCHQTSTKSLARVTEWKQLHGPGQHHTFENYEGHIASLQREAQELADTMAGIAHKYALNPTQKTPWSVSAFEQNFAWSKYFAKREARELADTMAGIAHKYALNPTQKTPWSVSAFKQNFAWSKYFAKGGGKMDDVTVVVAIID